MSKLINLRFLSKLLNLQFRSLKIYQRSKQNLKLNLFQSK